MQAGVWPGRVHGEAGHAADLVGVAVGEEMVELRTVALELGALVEHLAERVLHDADVLADADLPAQLLLDVGRSRQVVGMDMGLDQPFEPEAVVADMVDDPVGGGEGDAPGRVVDVHDAVDDGAGIGTGILDHVGNRVGLRIEEGGDLGLRRRIDRVVLLAHARCSLMVRVRASRPAVSQAACGREDR